MRNSIVLPSLVVAFAAAAALVSAPAFRATQAADAANAKDKPAGRYFEMRMYHVADGKLDALHSRFRDHTLKLFKKHGIESVGYWTREKSAGGAPAGAKDAKGDMLVFILAYPDKPSRDRMWNAFATDPEWVKAKDESEKSGKLVEKVKQVFMTPAEYSPLK